MGIWIGIGIVVVILVFVVLMFNTLIGKKFFVPTSRYLDAKLLGGAALFGIGWGIYGYCPGPALSAMVYLDNETFIFVGSMLAGMTLANFLNKAS